jgi:hypothetical protein
MNEAPRKSHPIHGGRASSAAAGLLGAILIHPVVFAIARLKGVILGASVPMSTALEEMDSLYSLLEGVE